MGIVHRVSRALLLACLLLAGGGAAAQDEGGGIAAYDGFAGGVYRAWTYDWTPLYLATPEAIFNGPAYVSGVYEMNAAVYEFDDADHAGGALLNVHASLVERVEAARAEGDGALEVAINEDAGFGDASALVDLHAANGDDPDQYVRYAIVQSGTLLLVISATSTTPDGLATVSAVVAYCLDQGAKGGEVAFAEDGTSTGGLWDVLPPAGHESLGGLIPQVDEDVAAGT